MGRQRNSPHRKEKQASSEKEVNEIEVNNMSEKELREMVIRWLKRMEDKFDNMSKNQKEMKKNQEEMKNDITAVKNSIESIKSRLEEAEDSISELEDTVDAQPLSHANQGQGLWGLVNNAGISVPTAPNELCEDTQREPVGGDRGDPESAAPGEEGTGPCGCLGQWSVSGGGYRISKHGVEAFLDSLRLYLGQSCIQMGPVAPNVDCDSRGPTLKVEQQQRNPMQTSPHLHPRLSKKSHPSSF
ncbi:hypothetical protein QTO34_017407 [Cnephaeus nilssonii]|uniref:Uncharacterized protein n=1 Tax=Cnephaeus nilssonii TaxID=3371016 RepID=A0AA40I1Y0_CNENI|nr:hypothetical protein QTO34_017407 [Eptesicus nilssonii]